MEKLPEFPQKTRFIIKESVPAPQRTESGVPNALVTELLEKLPVEERSAFDSGKIEDFLISALEEGLTVSEIKERAKKIFFGR